MPIRAPKAGEKWGILGGAFDPVHYGHLTLAREIRKAAELDGILFVPSFNPPRKSDGCVASFDDRLAMVRLAIDQTAQFALSSIESESGQTGYSLHVVRAIKKKYADTAFSFIIGADLLSEIDSWYEVKELVKEVSVIAGSRPDSRLNIPSGFPPGSIRVVPTTLINLASREMRERIASGISLEALSEMTPSPVAHYIVERGLYT